MVWEFKMGRMLEIMDEASRDDVTTTHFESLVTREYKDRAMTKRRQMTVKHLMLL